MSQFIGPALPPNFKRHDSVESASSDQISSDKHLENKKTVVGPTLPSSLTKNDSDAVDDSMPKKRVYGPAIIKPESNTTHSTRETSHSDDDNVIGPVRPSSEHDLSSIYDEKVLQRKRQHDQEAEEWEKKKWKAETKNPEKEKKSLQREEWMLTLPEDRKQMNVTGPRQFSKSGNVNQVDKSWMESPLEAKHKQEEEKYDPKADYQVRRQEEQSKVFDSLNAIRGPSLYEAHQEKIKKSNKDEGGSIANVGYVRPFDRDKDLDTRKLDTQSRKKLVDSSKLFNSNFVRGSQ